jgi:signal peptidase I
VILDNLAYNLREPLWGTPLKRIGAPQKGDIITFRYPKEPEQVFKDKVDGFPQDPATIYLYRVIAVAGETIEIKGTQLFINGQLMTESYAKYESDSSPLSDFGPYLVPVNQVFVMGDNRNNALDSRMKGGVPLENIIAKAKGFYWSEDETTGQIRWERIGKALH